MNTVLIDLHPHSDPVTPISLANLAAVLRRSGHETDLLSLSSGRPFSPAALRNFLQEKQPRLLGFTAYQRNFFQIRAIARMAKEIVPGCRTLIGGPQASFLPEEALADLPEFDFVGHGEGELVIQAVAEAVDGGVLDTAVPGTSTRMADGSWLRGDPLIPPDDLDAYPSPWLDGVLDPADWDEAIMLTSRGCPHHCAFCVTPAAFGPCTRAHSVERVLEDISVVASRGRGRLWFADPNFSYDSDRVLAILDGIARRGLSVEMWIETRADMLTPDLLRLLARTGVHTLALGLESAVPRVLERSGKAIEPDAIREAAVTALGAGLDVELFSQYGLPGESKADACGRCDSSRTAASPSAATPTPSRCSSTSVRPSSETPRRTGSTPCATICRPISRSGTSSSPTGCREPRWTRSARRGARPRPTAANGSSRDALQTR